MKDTDSPELTLRSLVTFDPKIPSAFRRVRKSLYQVFPMHIYSVTPKKKCSIALAKTMLSIGTCRNEDVRRTIVAQSRMRYMSYDEENVSYSPKHPQFRYPTFLNPLIYLLRLSYRNRF